MSAHTDATTTTAHHTDDRRHHTSGYISDRRISSETKPSFKTSELVVYVLAVLGVLIAAAMTDASDFGAQEAWRYVTYLTVGYLISRGLAKAGSRNFFDDNDDNR